MSYDVVVPEEYGRAVIRLRKAIKAVKDERDEEAKRLNVIMNGDLKAWPEYESARDAFSEEQRKLHDKIEEASK